METVDQSRLRIETFIKERAPEIDVAPGSVFSELLTKFQGQVQNEVYNSIAALEAAKTVKDVLTSAEDTYSPIIERLASNYNTYRNEGKKANGHVKVYVTQNRTYFLPEGFKFVQANLNFEYQTTNSYTASVTTGTLKQEGGLFYFIIPVEAIEIGQEKQVSHGTKFVPGSNSALSEFVDAIAFGSFDRGENRENDRELITRFKLGLSTKTLISPNAIQSTLKDRYPNFKAFSVIGMADTEQIRGRNNPLGITLPGVVDVYVRTCYALPTQVVTLTGTQISSGPNFGLWQINIPATAVPGFYRVISIVKTGSKNAGTGTFTQVAYGYDNVNYARKNNVTTTEEARFTKYQTCTVIFGYPAEEVTPDNESFDVTVSYQPQIAEIQDLFLSDTERIPCADYLVKGIVPCNTSIKLKLVKKNSLDQLDVPAIKSAIFSYINNLPIGESISASRIIDICHSFNIKRVDLPVLMQGSILVPFATNDVRISISGTDTLEIPNYPDKGVTPNTTAFFINILDEHGNEAIGIETV